MSVVIASATADAYQLLIIHYSQIATTDIRIIDYWAIARVVNAE